MTHPRESIRDAVVASIGTVPALIGRVFPTRTRPTDAAELPVALVYTLNETAEPASIAGRSKRILSTAIELRVANAGAVDAALDKLCESVEAALRADPRLGRRAINSFLASTTIGLDGEGETRQALATLTYTVEYTTP